MKFFLEIAFFLVAATCIGDTYCAEKISRRQILLGQVIELPDSGIQGGKVRGNCLGNFPMYSADAVFCRNAFFDHGIKSNSFPMSHKENIQRKEVCKHQSNAFLEFATSKVLDYDKLIQNITDYTEINAKDESGRTAFYHLVARSDTTVELVKTFLLNGADLKSNRFYLASNGDFKKETAYNYAIRYVGASPKLENIKEWCPYLGNKEVIKFVFHEMVYRKLEKLKKKRKNEKEMQRIRKEQEKQERVEKIKRELSVNEFRLREINPEDWSKVSFWRKETNTSGSLK